MRSSLSPAGGWENAKPDDQPDGEGAKQRDAVVDAIDSEIADGKKSKIGRDRPGAGESGFAEPGMVAFGADDQWRDQG
jgi:hypothetical protein